MVGQDYYRWIVDSSRCGYLEQAIVPGGTVVWQTALSGYLYASSMVADNDILYVTASKILYALSISSGNLLWQRSFPAFLEPPVVDGDTIYLIVAMWISSSVKYQEVYAIDKQTSELLWNYRPQDPSGSSGAPIIINESLVFDNGRGLISLNKTNGQLLWSRSTTSNTWYWDVSGDPAANLVYQWSGILEAINVDTGQVIWSYEDFTGYTGTTPIVVDGIVYQVNLWEDDDKAYLYSFDAVTGALRNKVEIYLISGDYVFMTAANGILYITTNQYYYPLIRAIDLSTGATVWESPELNPSVSPIVVADGKIFVDSYDQGLFVYGGSTNPVNVEVLDPTGSPVTQVITNTEGWPTPNPLTVQVTLNCPSDEGGACLKSLDFGLGSSDQEARFYVYDRDLISPSCLTMPANLDSLNSLREYNLSCSLVSLAPGQTITYSLNLWIQPSITATLELSATWGADSDSQVVQISEAKIHPLVVIPGFAETFPPEHGEDLDPIMHVFDNLFEVQQRTGYELGEPGSGATLIPFGYDWLERIGDTGTITLTNDIQSIVDTSTSQKKPYVDYDKVDIIAHSMGGLVARSFIEDNSKSNEMLVNKLITLGSPHQGTPSAYAGWFGGENLLMPNHIMAALVYGLYHCSRIGEDQLGPAYVSFFKAWNLVNDPDEFYKYTRHNIRSVQDLLPIYQVDPPYLLDNQPPCDEDYPEDRPSNHFLEDLASSVGPTYNNYDINKLGGMPVIAYYDSNYLILGRFYVNPSPDPPPPQPLEEKWLYGELAKKDNGDFDGKYVLSDSVIPAYSANLKETNAISSFANIYPREAGYDGTENKPIQHMQLTSHPILVRQLISDTTGIDVVNNM